MRVLEFEIPTRHNRWVVQIQDCDRSQIAFYVGKKGSIYVNQPGPWWGRDRAIPQSIWRRARCFLLNPDRFGTLRRV